MSGLIATTIERGGQVARRALARIVDIRAGEGRAAALSFCYFFCVLAAYYIVRPIRDELGLVYGKAALQWNFLYVFLVMLAAVPLFGWVVSAFARARIVPVIYAFFAANLALFWLLLGIWGQTPALAATIFVWGSVFNLFVISLFWSVMSDLWASEPATRLYGVITAGGTIGAIAGGLIADLAAGALGTRNLLLVSAAFLLAALALAMRLATPASGLERAGAARGTPGGGGVLEGAAQVWRSPYLAMIALGILIGNIVSTYFYLEQATIVPAALADPVQRVQLFARMNYISSVLQIVLQVAATSRMMRRFGVGITAATLPAAAMLGFGALAAWPTVTTIAVIIVAERAIGFAFASPAMRVLYTLVAPAEKYKAQNFIDTVIYRGGDAASAALFAGLKGLGLGLGAIAVVVMPVVAGWLALTLALGRLHDARAAGRGPE